MSPRLQLLQDCLRELIAADPATFQGNYNFRQGPQNFEEVLLQAMVPSQANTRALLFLEQMPGVTSMHQVRPGQEPRLLLEKKTSPPHSRALVMIGLQYPVPSLLLFL
mmetsp:Transcript_33634/g.61277  ORF Transcript_33634/g.61277 Transcript_33634/m.61277 type:complete len:108 (-) Transcript_33634:90-413(-)